MSIVAEIHKGFKKQFPELAERCCKNGISVYLRKGRRRDMLGLQTWFLSYCSVQVTGYMRDNPERPYTIQSINDRINQILDELEAGRKEVSGWSRSERALHCLKLLEDTDLARHYGDRRYREGAWYTSNHNSGDHAFALVSSGMQSIGVSFWDESNDAISVESSDLESVEDIFSVARRKASELKDANNTKVAD